MPARSHLAYLVDQTCADHLAETRPALAETVRRLLAGGQTAAQILRHVRAAGATPAVESGVAGLIARLQSTN